VSGDDRVVESERVDDRLGVVRVRLERHVAFVGGESVPAEIGGDDAATSHVRPDESPVRERAAATVEQEHAWSGAAVVHNCDRAMRRGYAVFGQGREPSGTLCCARVR
jgi:hypothetical protein